ncbi:Multidrug DMT transporter permease [Cupriavidus sp. H18C1]|uniref:DMT family transporter n=1 Tax=Cupriavidus sp. H18C1 TaxID=3241601 RepID=UPI003BB88B63
MVNSLRGTAEMTASMVLSGTIGWFVVESGQPIRDVVFWRCLFGALTLLAVCGALGMLRQLTWRTLGLAALGGVAIVMNWLLLFAAYPRASISIATAVYNTQPFMLVALGALLFSERITLTKLAWLLIAFAGVLMIVQAKPDHGHGATDYLGGIALALGAAFFYAVAAIITKRLFGVPPHLIALIQACVGMAMLAPFANLSDFAAYDGSWPMLVTIGVVHTGLVYILLYGAIQKLSTAMTAALSFIYPVVAIVVDMVAFGLRLDWAQWAGAAAILIAAAGMTLGWRLPFARRSGAAATRS